MKWFGRSWNAPVCGENAAVATPIGAVCPECEQQIGETDQGFILPSFDGRTTSERAYHRLCFNKALGIEDRRETLQ